MTNKNWTKDELENYNLLVEQTVRRCKKPDKVRESVEALAFIATEAKHKEAIAERRQSMHRVGADSVTISRRN